MHDVELEVHVDHGDEPEEQTEQTEPEEPEEQEEESDIEVVHSTIKFSDLYSESSVDQMQYELRNSGFVIDSPDTESSLVHHDHDHDHDHDQVESDDPHLDGGVLLDPEHKH